jgi:hypothetical protein
MKSLKLFTLILISLFLFQFVSAQAPQGVNYQAVARDASGNIWGNKNVSIRITIRDTTASSLIYQETHNVTTNQFGLFTLTIGNGTPLFGTFSFIGWGSITPWMYIDMDAAGGSSFVSMGASQLLSVPYALNVDKVGQSSAIAYGNAILTLDTNTKVLTQVPGLTQSVNVPAGCTVYVSTFGGVQTTSTSVTGYSIVDMVITQDGVLPPNGGFQRIVAANTTGLTRMIQNWSFGQTLVLTPGTHTIAVKAICAKGSPAYICSDNTSILQGMLTVSVHKN